MLVYYQMMFYIVKQGSDPYMDVFYMGLFEIPTGLAAWYIVKTYRRKPVYSCFYAVSLMSTIALLFVGPGKIATYCEVGFMNLQVSHD